MLFTLFYIFTAWPHQVGIEAWCITYSPSHRVCMYKSEAICQSVLKSIRDFESHALLDGGESISTNFKKICEPKLQSEKSLI